MINYANRNPTRSVIIRVINKIGRPRGVRDKTEEWYR